MASVRDSPVPRVPVCLTCGDKGETKLLIYCRECLDSAVHHYCMDNFSPDDDDINWVCWDCAANDIEAVPLRKSERISSKRLKTLEARNYWKERLNQNNRVARISNGISEAGQVTIDHHLPIVDMEKRLLTERQQDLEILQEKKSVNEIPSHSEEHNESVEIDELTFATKSNLPLQEENNMKSSDVTQIIQEVEKKKRILLLNDSPSSQDEGNSFNLKVLSSVANDHCTTPNTSRAQPSLEPDHFVSAEPVLDTIWRGWFNIKQETETCVEILAHLSNKACSKVYDAATAIPPTLDVQVLGKDVMWPRSFRILPPTAASIALYFFPACGRDERVFDSLLEDVIEKDLALKAMINNVELLIFSSCELPLQHWRFKSKYFLWGVFRQKQRSCSSTEMTTSVQRNISLKCFEPSKPKVAAENKDSVHSESADHLRSPSKPNQSQLSMKSSQASNMLPSGHNTPNSLSSLPFEFLRVDNAVKQENSPACKMSQHG